ncbi:hypothetical protein ABG067_001391 [Albugo candida]|uniref:Uncharacterized protein n=1 Tax=Albugo candida TaxID=65357 RepID=A0A024GB13_9STRA|nr:unnamed protein product [Albugo candida]|eukprot:CCI43854.1 unnamed protein product [Albugo candida]
MVLFHVKRGDKNEFLHEASTETSNEDLIFDLCHLNNTRIRLAALADALTDLGRFGVAMKPNEQGLDAYQDCSVKKTRGEFYEEDPLGLRTGEGVSPQLRETMAKVSEDAKQYLQQFQMKRCTTRHELNEKLMNIRGAIMMAFPMGLPPHDPIKNLLDRENVEEALADRAASLDVTNVENTELWWAGKQFYRDQTVCDMVGKNEKTKIIVKLQKKGGGMPSREPGVTEEEQKAMMAFYFKKQEEMKKLADDDADDYMTSSWADPKALKNSLRGTASIRPF